MGGLRKRTFFAVHETVHSVDSGKAIVDLFDHNALSGRGSPEKRKRTYRVSGSKATRLESQTRQERVRFYDRLKRWGQSLCLVRLVRLLSKLEQNLLALGTDGLGQVRRQEPAKVRAVLGLTRLDVRRDSIADTSREETRGSLHDDAGIDEDEVGILIVERVLLELAAGGVDHRERRARRVGRRGRREDSDGDVEEVRDVLRAVDDLSAAERDHKVRLRLAPQRRQPVDLLRRRLAPESPAGDLELRLLECLDELFAGCVG